MDLHVFSILIPPPASLPIPSLKGNYKQGEKKPSEWEKIIANEATKDQSQKYTSNYC